MKYRVVLKLYLYQSGICNENGPLQIEIGMHIKSQIENKNQAPVPLTIFWSSSKFDQNWESSSLKYA